jgi:hypothetical protein
MRPWRDVMRDERCRNLLSLVAAQQERQGFAVLVPGDITELEVLRVLEEAGLVTSDSTKLRFDHFGNGRGDELTCRVTELGSSALSQD